MSVELPNRSSSTAPVSKNASPSRLLQPGFIVSTRVPTDGIRNVSNVHNSLQELLGIDANQASNEAIHAASPSEFRVAIEYSNDNSRIAGHRSDGGLQGEVLTKPDGLGSLILGANADDSKLRQAQELVAKHKMSVVAWTGPLLRIAYWLIFSFAGNATYV